MLYFRKLLEAIGLFSFVIIISSFFFVYEITRENSVKIKDRYDAIVILSGNPERAYRASKLFFEKKSKIILLSKEQKILEIILNPMIQKKLMSYI